MKTQQSFLSIVVFVLMCIAAIPLPGQPLNSIVLYGILPFVAIVSFFQEKKININQYTQIFYILFIWLILTSLFSVSIESSFQNVKRTLGSVLACYIFAVQAKRRQFIPFLYIVFIVLFLSSINYAVNNILINIDEIGSRQRVSDEMLNANTLAYYTVYVTFICFLLGEIVKSNKLQRIFQLLFFGVIPLSFWVALITASRQVLIIQIPLIAVLCFLRYVKFGTAKTKIIILLLIIILLAYFADSVIGQYNNSYLAERSEVSITEDSRFILIKESIQLGLNNLFVGVGPGCVSSFTTERAFAHNTFLELFAGTGIVGMIIFIVLVWKYIKTQIIRYKKTDDKLFMYFIVFGFIFLVQQFLYVFYASLWLMGFFMLVATHSDTYYKSKYINDK